MAIEPSKTFDGLVLEIQTLWNKEFVQHMKPETNEKFPKDLQLISKHYRNKNYFAAHNIMKPMLDWASFQSDICEGTGPGFNYIGMFNLVGKLDDFVGALKVAS